MTMRYCPICKLKTKHYRCPLCGTETDEVDDPEAVQTPPADPGYSIFEHAQYPDTGGKIETP